MADELKNHIIAWWSGGIASAVACKWAIETFKNISIFFVDTFNEHDDTYRFLKDCQEIYQQPIKTASNKKFTCIQDVWRKYKALNNAHGAICSSELKREVRIKLQNLKIDYGQVFGFDVSERKRHENMRKNYPEINAISPLIDLKYTKEMCIAEIESWGIGIPIVYKLGYRNNNCFKTGCVQGGVGYWQKIQREESEKFEAMAQMEHELTLAKGKPVTVLRVKKDGEYFPLFLKPHSSSPYDISMAKGREPKPLMECTGFCRTEEYEELDDTLKVSESL